MEKSKIFFYFCLSFLAGVFVDSFFSAPRFFIYVLLFFSLILLIASFKYKKAAFFGFCFLFLIFGVVRHQQAFSEINNSILKNFNDKNKAVTLTAIVVESPVWYGESAKLTVLVEGLQVSGEHIKTSEKILLTVSRYPEYHYGDKIEIFGKLKSPPIFEGFNYGEYLKKDGIYSVIDWPRITLRGQGFGNPVMEILFSFKDKFKKTSKSFISPPEEGFLEALIFGDEENISKEWKEKLNITGTRHIAAVSGMNITILAVLIMSFVLSIGFWRSQAFYLSVILLFFYILMIGAPASGVRAGIMGGLLLLSQYLGRMSKASRAVFIASVLMLLQNPLLLKLDVGFQLSFLAVMGLIFIQPFLSERFKKIPNPGFFPVRTTLSATLSAQVFTLPILIYNFGRISLVSPVANILIVPILAPLTISILLFGLAGMVSWNLGLVLSWPVYIFLAYLVKIIDLFSGLPVSSFSVGNIHWAFPVFYYLILGYFVFRFNRRQKLKFMDN